MPSKTPKKQPKTISAALPAPARIAINPFASLATDRHNRTAPPASTGNVKVEAHTGARGLGSVNRLWQLLQERLAEAEKVLPAETLDTIKGDMDFDTMSIRTWERNSVMLDLLREAMETSLCDVCETYQADVITTTGEDGINICASCRAASERDMVVTNEQLEPSEKSGGLPKQSGIKSHIHTTVGEAGWQAVKAEYAAVVFVREYAGGSYLTYNEDAQLLASLLRLPIVNGYAALPRWQPSKRLPELSDAVAILTTLDYRVVIVDHDGAIEAIHNSAPTTTLTEQRPATSDYRNAAIQSENQCWVHIGESFLNQEDSAYWKAQTAWFAHVADFLLTPPNNPDTTPVDPTPDQPLPGLQEGDEVYYGGATFTYKVQGAAVWRGAGNGYWYHLRSKYSTLFVPANKIKLFAPNPANWIGHYALMTVRGHQEGRAKPSQEKVVVVEMQAGFVTVRRGTTHNRLHFSSLTLLPEMATAEEMAAPAPTWELPRIKRGLSEGVR